MTATHPVYMLLQQTSRKFEIFITLFLSGVRYHRAMFNFMEIQFHERVDAFVGIGAEALLTL